MSRRWRAWVLGLSLATVFPAWGQDQPITRQEYEALKQQVQTLTRELQDLRSQQKLSKEELDALVEEILEDARRASDLADARRTGLFNFLLSGNATISYVDREDDASTFRVVFRPAILWKLNERMLFESKLEIRLRDDEEDAEVRLEYANLAYILNEHVTVGAGKFYNTFGLYNDRFFPGKLLDDPLIYGPNGLVPHSQLGAFARGAFAMGKTEWNYQVFVSNGAELRTDAARAGLLNGSNWVDESDNKTVGGRIGFLPHSSIELGYSISYGDVEPAGGAFGDTSALVQGVDLHYFDQIDAIKGTLDLRAEYVWSDIDDVVFDPAGTGGFGPLRFDNQREGGYVEVAYRPTMFQREWMKRLELIGRFDWLNAPGGAPGVGDQERTTLSVLYWVTPTVSLRGGYIWDETDEADDRETLYFQLGVSF